MPGQHTGCGAAAGASCCTADESQQVPAAAGSGRAGGNLGAGAAAAAAEMVLEATWGSPGGGGDAWPRPPPVSGQPQPGPLGHLKRACGKASPGPSRSRLGPPQAHHYGEVEGGIARAERPRAGPWHWPLLGNRPDSPSGTRVKFTRLGPPAWEGVVVWGRPKDGELEGLPSERAGGFHGWPSSRALCCPRRRPRTAQEGEPRVQSPGVASRSVAWTEVCPLALPSASGSLALSVPAMVMTRFKFSL